MAAPQVLKSARARLRLGHAAIGVLILWFGFTGLQTLTVLGQIGENLSAALALLPGILGVGVLAAAGFSNQDCFLQRRPLSKLGTAALALSFLLMAPVWATGQWTGWNPAGALVFAPGSAIAQELFFRAVLLPVFLALFKGRPAPALLLQALLFGLWHIAPAFLGAPLWAVAAVMGVPFLAGLLWGWQVRRDGTVYWVTFYHALILIGNSFFSWVK
ncbi:MAG: CPBP family glutamic-type intramembrane protease [Chloroflexi bacterium]|nr:CPBP family glutamic-type intramembrane protease [Chloroflexota bacterium]